MRLEALLGGALSGESTRGGTAAILSVKGSALKAIVQEQMANVETRLPQYRDAQAQGIKGYPWEKAVSELEFRVQICKLVHDNIGDGPHQMTVGQLCDFKGEFAPYRTVDEVVASIAKAKTSDGRECDDPTHHHSH